MKNGILLIASALVTLLFIIFPTTVYELVDGQSEFANEMYNENLYLIVALIAAGVAWGSAALFYYVVNSVSFSRWYHWLIVLLAAAVVSTIAGYSYLSGTLSTDYGSSLTGFSVVNFATTAVLFVLASFGMRWWSSNCRHTPFPE